MDVSLFVLLTQCNNKSEYVRYLPPRPCEVQTYWI